MPNNSISDAAATNKANTEREKRENRYQKISDQRDKNLVKSAIHQLKKEGSSITEANIISNLQERGKLTEDNRPRITSIASQRCGTKSDTTETTETTATIN